MLEYSCREQKQTNKKQKQKQNNKRKEEIVIHSFSTWSALTKKELKISVLYVKEKKNVG